MPGKNSTSWGNAINTATWHISAIRNGTIPRNIVDMGTSFATPLITKTLIPTGGVIIPISDTLTISIPNHIGSKPSDVAKGKKIKVEVDGNTLLLLDFGENTFAYVDATYCMRANRGPATAFYGSKGDTR